ncbi:DNA end-binding protein Ku [Silvibacterium bohemicum]|uniref:Non-homologous end joining protein Ku n=1 Tax=Silvibacterium bohemicum TaxID=1577686 RepID=A0A841JW89_9BACT|nr:Ku protein [Silvibacterium bohemicum]MBB6143999.1 DNA end-binding protein Ku [Silvibacterium bohemicum]
MARPYWSGQLQISLVSFGIQLFPAVSTASEISFHQIDRKTGERVHHLKVIDGNDPVDKAEIVKGYEYRPGKYVVVEPEEVDRLRIESKKTLEIAQFVSLDELPLELFEKPYFVLPDGDKQAAAFAVVQKALAKSGKAGLGEIVFAGREHLMAVTAPHDDKALGLMAYTLRYGSELRKTEEYFGSIKAQTVDARQLTMANELIEHYTQPFDIDAFKDDYEDALRKLVEAKVNKQPLPLEEKAPKHAKVIDLMDALKASLKASGPRARTKTASRTQSAPKKPANKAASASRKLKSA